MAALTDIREGLKDRLDTIAGLRAFAYVPGQINPPAAVVEPANPVVEYHQAMAGGLNVWRLKVRVFEAANADTQSQQALDSYIAPTGTKSVKAAIEGDKTLGGVVADLTVDESVGYGEYAYGNVSYRGFELTVTVYAGES